uniref:Uncharacterized protein n=1 Tax=Buteo japonicus TaxID=224669 RepID=A0A8B9ZD66_9AVES
RRGAGGGREAAAGSGGRNLKEWLREQFCDHPIEHCEDTRLHDAAYVGDLPTLKSLLQEESFQSRINEKSVWCCGWLPCTPLRIAATAGHGPCGWLYLPLFLPWDHCPHGAQSIRSLLACPVPPQAW